jgi:gamma-glutamyl phosphate reductase
LSKVGIRDADSLSRQLSKLSPRINDLRRLVVKIGSTLLVDNSNRIDRGWLNDLAEDVAILRAAGHQVLIVSSGAVGAEQLTSYKYIVRGSGQTRP